VFGTTIDPVTTATSVVVVYRA